jgi:hypothetical protein
MLQQQYVRHLILYVVMRIYKGELISGGFGGISINLTQISHTSAVKD